MAILEGYDRKHILQSDGFIEAMNKAVNHQTEDIIIIEKVSEMKVWRLTI